MMSNTIKAFRRRLRHLSSDNAPAAERPKFEQLEDRLLLSGLFSVFILHIERL